MTVVNMRGPNGCGKSWIVHRLFQGMPVTKVNVKGRRKPAGYVYHGRVFVLGHYEIENGGFDNVDLNLGYELIHSYRDRGFDVLYEGKNQSDDLERALEVEAQMVFINTPLEDCVASVRSRGHSLSEKIIGRTWRKARREEHVLRERGVTHWSLPRFEAKAVVADLLDVRNFDDK